MTAYARSVGPPPYHLEVLGPHLATRRRIRTALLHQISASEQELNLPDC